MDNTSIKKHNFEIAKNKIEKFSKNLPSDPSFSLVETDGGLFGLGDHKVTGSEMNAFIDVVQDKLIDINSSLSSIIGEFKEVYNAFDALDGEYINGIIGAVESAEKASNQALKAQTDIVATLNMLQKTVIGLTTLKTNVERIEKIVYASNILSYDEIAKKLDDNYKIKQIVPLLNTTSTLQIEFTDFHQLINNFIEKVNQSTKYINNDIAMLQQYRFTLESYEHLDDVDTIWKDVEEYKNNLVVLHQQISNFISETHTTEVEIKESIQKMIESNTSTYLLYEKKIKLAYTIGGSAVGLSIIHFILQILGVL